MLERPREKPDMATNIETDLGHPESSSGLFGHFRFDVMARVRQLFQARERDVFDANAAIRFSKKHAAKNGRVIARAGARLMAHPPTKMPD